MNSAEKMREITAKADAILKKWWLSEGIREILDQMEIAANQGKSSYTGFGLPKYVREELSNQGFKVKRSWGSYIVFW